MGIRTGPRTGELAWMPLTHWRVLRTLHNPRYPGIFAYGRRREAATLSQAATGIMVAAADMKHVMGTGRRQSDRRRGTSRY